MVKVKFMVALSLLTLSSWVNSSAVAQGTAFTYQGKLTDSGNLANGNYDLQFKLFDTATVGTGTQLGNVVMVSNVIISNGSISVPLDFGACPTCFNGSARFLEIAVRPAGVGAFTALGPRQQINSTPYAIKSQNAATATAADGLSVACVNCVTSNHIASVNGSAVTGTIPVASVPVGSANYIQNGTSQQATSNFHISGNGTVGGSLTAGGTMSANSVNATTQFNLGGQRLLSAAGNSNLFVGINAGSGGGNNAFFGFQAGFSHVNGINNAFFGTNTGFDNTSGTQNSFFGTGAGGQNTTGFDNAFFGAFAGGSNTTGVFNTFIGSGANFNTSSPTGDDNTLLGYATNVNSGISNGTAIGANASVTQSHSLVLGSILGENGCGAGCATVKVGIGTTTPAALLDVQRDGGTIPETARFTTYGATNLILGRSSNGTRIAPAATPIGRVLLQLGATGHNGTDFATTARATIQLIAGEDWTSTAQGTNIRFLTTANGTTTTSTRMLIADDGNVGIGTTAPLDKLDVNGDVRVGTGTTGCVKDSDGTLIAGNCSSDVRLKRDITPFPHLLDKLVQLQPVTFYWRSEEFKDRHFGAKQSYGLIAQEVEKVLPELVSEDEHGYKAVNYSKLPLLSLQSIKELKQENDALKDEIVILKKKVEQVEALKRLVCKSNPDEEICKP